MGVRLYADETWVRLRQVAGDATVLAITWWVIRTARRLAEAIGEFAAVADGLDRSGRTVSEAAGRASEAVEGIPAVGNALATPFRSLGGAGTELVGAGEQVGRTVAAVAFWVPAVFVALVLGWVLLWYLPRRTRWVREVRAVEELLRSPDADRLLAVRAAATRPLRQLRREVDDPAGALAEGRHAELAAVEMRALGLAPARLLRVPT
ncbi:MAG: hypothetical protein WEB09_03935 [Nitriliruptor sp.]